MNHPEHPGPHGPPSLERLPRGPLWWCLLVPSIATLLSVLIMFAGGNTGYAPDLWFLPLGAGPVTGFICTAWFVRILRVRYRGRSLVLMGMAYAFGQLIVTPPLGFFGCAAIYSAAS